MIGQRHLCLTPAWESSQTALLITDRTCLFRLGDLAATIGVAAQAVDFASVPDAFTVGAAIFPLLGGRAGAGSIRAFLWGIGHSSPSPVPSVPFCSRHTNFAAGTDARDSSANSSTRTSKIGGRLRVALLCPDRCRLHVHLVREKPSLIGQLKWFP
jgi:hypothetical protein